MHLRIRQAFALLACASVFWSSLLSGLVICTAEAGHCAIELPHPDTGCPSDDHSHAHSAPGPVPQGAVPPGSVPCQDRPVGDELATQSAKARVNVRVDVNHALPWLHLEADGGSTTAFRPTSRSSYYTLAPLPQSALIRLATVVLLT
jgi:hypothetical protein